MKWKAKNGTWDQVLQIEKKADGRWLQATTVNRNDAVIFSNVDEGYPKDPAGAPIYRA